jgi:hypothetical protein
MARTMFLPIRKTVKATLRSNVGDKQFSLIFGARCNYEGKTGFECEVLISTNHWDGEHEHPVVLRFEGMSIHDKAIAELRNKLGNYVEMPLHEIATSQLEDSFKLAIVPWQEVVLTFGKRGDTIDERKPVLSIRVRVNSTVTETRWVTDQSCLALFTEELSCALK